MIDIDTLYIIHDVLIFTIIVIIIHIIIVVIINDYHHCLFTSLFSSPSLLSNFNWMHTDCILIMIILAHWLHSVVLIACINHAQCIVHQLIINCIIYLSIYSCHLDYWTVHLDAICSQTVPSLPLSGYMLSNRIDISYVKLICEELSITLR